MHSAQKTSYLRCLRRGDGNEGIYNRTVGNPKGNPTEVCLSFVRSREISQPRGRERSPLGEGCDLLRRSYPRHKSVGAKAQAVKVGAPINKLLTIVIVNNLLIVEPLLTALVWHLFVFVKLHKNKGIFLVIFGGLRHVLTNGCRQYNCSSIFSWACRAFSSLTEA